MNELSTVILLLALLGASAQDSTLEEKAVNRVQQTLASRYDPTLPSRPFGSWLTQIVGPQSGVSWRLGECVEQNGTASEWEQGVPACVEATAILPDDRKIVAQIHVGSFKQLSSMTKFHFAAIENESQFQSVRRLSDLAQLVKDPSSVKGPDEVKKMNVIALPQIKSNGAPQFYYAKSAALLPPPQITPVENAHEPPPPPTPAVAPRVSKGVVQGDALVKAQPIYPSIAKQINAAGEVQVAIVISENGRVIEAKAIKGHPVLRAAAEDAARKWVFRPTLLDGKPVKQPGTLTFIFIPPPPPTSVPPTAETGEETPKKIKVSGGVLQGNAIKRVQPLYPPIAKAGRASGPVEVQITISETGEVIEASVISGHPLLRDAALQAARQWLFALTELSGVPVKVQGILTFNFMLDDEEPSPAPFARSAARYTSNTEQLGKRTVEGVECEGTRVVTTLPAGAIGNERPIETVKETWYSPELQLMILSKRSDPRFGESTYRVTNIARYEPDAEHFQIPSDYTIIDNRAKKVEVDVNEFEEMRRKLEETRKKAEGARKPNNQ